MGEHLASAKTMVKKYIIEQHLKHIMQRDLAVREKDYRGLNSYATLCPYILPRERHGN